MEVSLKKIINKLSSFVLTTNILLGLPLSAQAVTFSGQTSGEWGLPDTENPSAVVSLSSEDGGTNNRLTWGTPGMAGINNYVQFNGLNFSSTPNHIFKLGELFYQNGSTFIDTNFDGDFPLNLELALTLPLTSTESFEFLFNILNTPNNTDDPVLNGDLLRFSTAGMSGQTFHYEGIEYTLQLIGFSTDEGQTILHEFNSAELSISEASLYGKITFASPPASVPEPSVIAALSILSIYLATRQRK
ncbi:choice-of-anchor K domain-containing protein [Aerosakkonemataceae cyanobacterium BLCC-F50]|uniref:Choice-of-anchor K domain-containing protein n=1 Tax=Floridaenema flaviceps BLCC-F50 TaxID=3153642 RepID=A0ABV4XTT2_9CYAN